MLQVGNKVLAVGIWCEITSRDQVLLTAPHIINGAIASIRAVPKALVPMVVVNVPSLAASLDFERRRSCSDSSAVLHPVL